MLQLTPPPPMVGGVLSNTSVINWPIYMYTEWGAPIVCYYIMTMSSPPPMGGEVLSNTSVIHVH